MSAIDCCFTPLEANEVERLLMLDTLRLIRKRLRVPAGTDADTLVDIERIVRATLDAVEDDFHASAL